MTSQLTDKIPAYLSRYKVLTNGATDPGQVRTNNEDSYIVFASKQARTTYSSTGPLTVAVLADGVGGATAGERASSIAVDTVRKSLESASVSSIKNQVDTAILEANSAIYSAAQANPELSGMASTIVVALIEDCSLYVAHVGDSRAYLVRDQVAHQLTVDHSWIQSALDAGQLSASEVEDHPKRHVVTRSLGPQPSVEADHTIRMPAHAIDSHAGSGPTTLVDRLLLRPGDIVLLCSDGLTDALSLAHIQQVINTAPFAEAADALVRSANEEGGPDNITVTMLQVTTNSRPLVMAGTGFVSILLLGIILFSLWPRPQLPPVAVQQPSASSTPAVLPTFTADTVLAANLITNTPSPATTAATITSDTATPSSTPLASHDASVAVTVTGTQTAATVTEIISAPVNNSGVAGVAPKSAFDVTTNTVTALGGVAVTASVTSPASAAARSPTPIVAATAPASGSTPVPMQDASVAATQGSSMHTDNSMSPLANAQTEQGTTVTALPAREGLACPSDGTTFTDTLTFGWTVDSGLRGAQAEYQLVYWTPSETHDPLIYARAMGPPISTSDSTTIYVKLDQRLSPSLATGEYLWNVRVSKRDDAAIPVFLDRTPRRFYYYPGVTNSEVPGATTFPAAVPTSTDHCP